MKLYIDSRQGIKLFGNVNIIQLKRRKGLQVYFMWETHKVDHEMMKNEANYGENKGQLQKYNSKNIRSV